MGLYSGGLIIGRIFASEILGAYFRKGLFIYLFIYLFSYYFICLFIYFIFIFIYLFILLLLLLFFFFLGGGGGLYRNFTVSLYNDTVYVLVVWLCMLTNRNLKQFLTKEIVIIKMTHHFLILDYVL